MAETKSEKARRYLAEGRLSVVHVSGVGDHFKVVAYARGESGDLHACGHDPDRAPHWRCTCRAWTTSRSHPDCSHLTALKLVTSTTNIVGYDRRVEQQWSEPTGPDPTLYSPGEGPLPGESIAGVGA